MPSLLCQVISAGISCSFQSFWNCLQVFSIRWHNTDWLQCRWHQLSNLNHKPIYLWLCFKFCFQIIQIDVFFLCKQNILIPSICGRGIYDQNRICVWRTISFICTLLFNEEINAGISLFIMNQNINCYCFVLFSWEHTLLGFLKFVVWVWFFYSLPGVTENTLLPNKNKYNNAKSVWEKRQRCIQRYCT